MLSAWKTSSLVVVGSWDVPRTTRLWTAADISDPYCRVISSSLSLVKAKD
jgi:hypothetical protein